MNIETYGTGARLMWAARLLSADKGLTEGRHLVLLPIPSTKNKTTVKDTDIPLSDTLASIDGKSLVVGYSLPPEYKKKRW